MAELPIVSRDLQPASGLDSLRCDVALGEHVQLVVELPKTQAAKTQLSDSELHARLPSALQRFATGELRNDRPVLDQVSAWNSPSCS